MRDHRSVADIEEEFRERPSRHARRPRPGPGRRVTTVELPASLADKPSQARPYDQDRWLDDPPWKADDPKLQQWEQAHGHDVRMKCLPEFGCLAIKYESDAREERITELKHELRRIKHGGYGAEAVETEAVLAQALGYSYDDEYGWATGDHTITTLAMEARSRIGDLNRQLRLRQAQIDELRRRAELAHAAGRDTLPLTDVLGVVLISDRPPNADDVAAGQRLQRYRCTPDCAWLETRQHAPGCKELPGDAD